MNKISMGKSDTVERLFVSLIGVQMLSFISQIIASVIDSIMIKQCLGSDALAAFSFANTMISLVLAAFGFLMTGVSVLVSKNASNQDENERNRAYSTAFVLALILGVALTFLYQFASIRLAAIAGAPEELRQMSADYIRGNSLGFVPYLLFAVLFPTVQIQGGKKQVMLSFSMMAASDIILDILNGYVFKLGIWGMGAATAISYFVGFFVVFVYQLNGKHLFRLVPRLISFAKVKEIFIYGYIFVFKQLMLTISGYVYNNFIVSQYNGETLAAYASAMSALSILWCISSAIGNTVSSLTGFYEKEEDVASLKRLIKASAKYSVLLNVIIMIIAVVLAGPIMRLFYKTNDDYFLIAVKGLRLFSLSIIIKSFNMAIRGYYQSMKMQLCNILFTFIQSLACGVMALFILNYLIGLDGVFLSFFAGELSATIILAAVLKIRTGEKLFPDALMNLPEAYRAESFSRFDASCYSLEEVMECSGDVADFCVKEGASEKVAIAVSLAVEEIAGNIIKYGFTDNKTHSIDIRVKQNTDSWIIRFYDDCNGFDPTKYTLEPEEKVEHNGIRMIKGLASNITYTDAFGLNNLSITFRE